MLSISLIVSRFEDMMIKSFRNNTEYVYFGVRSKNQADIRKKHLPSNPDLAFNQPLLTAGGMRPQKYQWCRVQS